MSRQERVSLHRSQSSENFRFREQVSHAGSSSRIGRLASPILLQFWTENFDIAYRLLELQNTLFNGREAAV
jgi:hypothetical protein